MKVSELTADIMMEYLRIDDKSARNEVSTALDHAISYVCNYIGFKREDLDECDDITQAVMIMTQDFYDNRAYQTQKDYNCTNAAVDSILRMHCVNLL